MKDTITELKCMIYKSKSPKMDNSHEINLNDLDRLLTKVMIKFDEIEKQNEELIRLLCLYIDSDFENGIDDLSGEACDYLIKIKQKPIEEILKEAE